jgi:hypothetical protein
MFRPDKAGQDALHTIKNLYGKSSRSYTMEQLMSEVFLQTVASL